MLRIRVFCRFACTVKKIRDDREEEHGHGKWLRMEEYFHNIGIDFSHGYCPECYNKAMIFLDNIPYQSG